MSLARIIPGDASVVLKHFGAGSVDLVVTDPPYPTISGGHGDHPVHRRPKGMLSKNDGRIFALNDLPPEAWVPEVFRVLADNAHFYLFTNFLNLERMMATCRSAGFDLHNLLIWQKQNATPNRWYMKNIEYVIFARKGRAFGIANPGSMTCQHVRNPVGMKDHPTEKPVPLLRTYIDNSVRMGGRVLDPFAGSGSTIEAARSCLRYGVGIELDPAYVQVACNRLGVLPG